MQRTSKKKKIYIRISIILVCILFFVGIVLGVLQLGCVHTERVWEQWKPTYEKQDIASLIYKENLTNEEYDVIYRQTGVTKVGVDGMREAGDEGRLLTIQNAFFKENEITVDKFAPFTYSEYIEEYMPMATLQDGDILVSSTTRVSWWRYGHAALVVNGKSGTLVESLSPGTNTKTNSASTFACLANFIILRPKADTQTKAQVVKYAKEKLIGLPYRMTTGIFSKKTAKEIKGTQCAHLVWHAYYTFGVDLDSTGGLVVKPQDMANSPNVEVVQAFGFDLDTLWT